MDLALFQFNAGDPIDFGASYDILYQYIRSVIPAGTAVTDISLDCWIKKAAA